MIFDKISNLAKYKSIPQVEAIIEFLGRSDPLSLPMGELPVKGKDLFVRVMSYHPKDEAENNFETHRNHIDVQCVISGVEKMQVTGQDNLTAVTAYDAEGDYQFFAAEKNISDVIVREGEFTVFFTGEAHKPGCRYNDQSTLVKKLVFKVRTSVADPIILAAAKK